MKNHAVRENNAIIPRNAETTILKNALKSVNSLASGNRMAGEGIVFAVESWMEFLEIRCGRVSDGVTVHKRERPGLQAG